MTFPRQQALPLRHAMEAATGLTITVRAPCEDISDRWFAWANRDGEDTATGYAQHTVANAEGDTEYAALLNLALDLRRTGRDMTRLDEAISHLSVQQGSRKDAA